MSPCPLSATNSSNSATASANSATAAASSASSLSSSVDKLATIETNADVTDTANSNSSEDTDNFEKLSPEEQSKRILEIYKEKFRVRRIRPDNLHSATMYGRIMESKTSSRRLRFIADSGTGVPILPIEIADEHDIEVRPVDPDEPGCIGASGHDLDIIGQCEMNVKIEGMKKVKRIHFLVANQSDDEILIDLATLVEWSILPKCFPMPMDEKERETKSKKRVKKVTVVESQEDKLTEVKEKRGSERSKLTFTDQEEGNFDNNQKMSQLKQSLLKEFKDIFKTELSVHDRIDIAPVNIETNANLASFRTSAKTTAIDTPLHLQNAATKELNKMIKAILRRASTFKL